MSFKRLSLLYVLNKFWCQLPEDDQITAPKRVGAV